MRHATVNHNSYRGPDAYFCCDECGQRWRRSQMYTRWDGLKVDWRCNDPRPPQMEPPDIYPEGQPFFDARPPQDQPDALVDGSTLQSVVGGIVRSVGVQAVYPTGQSANQPGDLSPLPILNAPAPTPAVSSTVATRTIRTGPVSAGGEQ